MHYPVFESKHWHVKLHVGDQSYLGRCLVMAKEPTPSLSAITQEQWLDFTHIVQQLESAATQAFGATMFNWTCLMNHAYRNNPPTPQVHWHFRPRYDHPVTFVGEVFEDNSFGSHYEQGTSRQLTPGLLDQVAQALRASL